MNATALLQQAVALENGGDLAGALALYQKVLKREPSNIDALFLFGRAQCLLGQIEAGAQAFRKIVTLRPDHAPGHTLLGMALFRLGRPQEALACLDRALAADPRFELALANKADVLAELGRHAEAVAAYDKALEVNAGHIAVWCNRGNALQALGRDADAIESFLRALALNPNMAEVHFNLANALRKAKRDEEAVQHYRRAVALGPGLADAYINLGSALIGLRRWQEAADACARAVALRPDSAVAHYNLGLALFDLERNEESGSEFDKALALEPNYARALHQKARLLFYVHGQLYEARKLLERAIDLDPQEIGNYVLLANVKEFAADDPLAERLEALLEGAGPRDTQDKVDLHFALAKIYRDMGKHEPSIRHLAQGNALTRQQIDYDESAVLGYLDDIRRVFTPALMREKSGHGDPSGRPIFIVGMPRSGSTLIEQILAGHPRVYGAGERKDFEEVLFSLTQAGLPEYPDLVPALTPAQFRDIGAAYLGRVAASIPASDFFTDKMLDNRHFVGLIRLALPNARIIHVRRNAVDTCLSCFSTKFIEGQAFAYDLGELGRYYRAYEQLMDHWREVLPAGAMLEVQYEDVVADTEGQARRLLAYCGLAWDPACLDFHKVERPVRTASAAQVRQPIYRGSIERWRRYADQLGPLLEALGEKV